MNTRNYEQYQKILSMFEKSDTITTREVAQVLHMHVSKASDKVKRLKNEGVLKALGTNQYRRYVWTGKQIPLPTSGGIDTAEFRWHRDPSSFKMRVSPHERPIQTA